MTKVNGAKLAYVLVTEMVRAGCVAQCLAGGNDDRAGRAADFLIDAHKKLTEYFDTLDFSSDGGDADGWFRHASGRA